MVHEHLAAQARRVITGVDAAGKSCITSDENTPVRLAGAGNTKCDIWRMDSLPTPMSAGDGLGTEVVTPPSETGFVYRVVTFPPDSEWDRSAGYGDASGPLAGSVPLEESGGIPGMHFTETVDILTVISGELHIELETGEAKLGPGDTLVQRGTKHAWSNRTDRPVVLVSVMAAATREPEETGGV